MQVARSTPGRGGTRQRILRILTRNDFWDVSRWLAGAYASSSDHLDQHKKPVLIRDHKIKWLDFGTTPDEGSLSPHPGFTWMKAGYSESIEWRKVRLTKQRNVDLTTDGLWAMPLNSGWVPVKSRRLQDWQKLKKYVPNNKHGDVCPNGVPALPEKCDHIEACMKNRSQFGKGQGIRFAHAASGGPSGSERGIKSEMAHEWARWLHNPCRLGEPHRFRAGDKIRNGPLVGKVAT